MAMVHGCMGNLTDLKMRLFAMSEGGKGLKNRFTRQIVNIFDFLKKQ